MEFLEALDAKVIGFNEMGRVKVMSTGEELLLMVNKGGMKESLKSRKAATSSQSTTATSANVGANTFDDLVFGSLGPQQNGSVRMTSSDFENGIRKYMALGQTRRIRSQINSDKDKNHRLI